MIKIQRIYSSNSTQPGYRILIDRLWPRGISKTKANLDDWDKSIAPSNELRKWFNHDPQKFSKFSKAYRKELAENLETPEFIAKITSKMVNSDIILLYSAKDKEHNQAIVLRNYLREKLSIKS
ncbi:MAG TPA: DUF488 family protein [Companilactobacillus farciminis]|uniref:DUF488 family protein n=2 Tax=Lactobacillaceae TaxID=33958 RepID=A0A921LCA8_9LACO|nr:MULTISPECIES: DUF488 family protein [Ligilactobacillus]MBN7273588.1 DUF488 family protein [Ligilactobacillus pobuzihii]GKS82348.1 hypothetical protein LPAF129_20340 [Ligilactobacillus pabuli]HJF87901.1 DUF488 family protein [Companilactobacillus farciminis]HLQ74883.1 DUF488 family protein [Alloiococcus sp.]